MIKNSLSKKQIFLLFICAFLMRAGVMFFFIQPNEYYKQPDSGDYHSCTLSIVSGNGMHRIPTNDPIFWRTPGYPPFAAFFYWLCGVKSIQFSANAYAQCATIWAQIVISSFIPLVLFYLAVALTQNAAIAYILAWLSVIHPGLVLASTFFLTEGAATIFFYLFLLFFYRLIIPQEKRFRPSTQLLLAILCLSIYTWMRPMGEFVGFFSAILLAIAGRGSWKHTLKQAALFAGLFFLTLAPWYYRNYTLTGECFFCPTTGTYLNVFSAPKILRRTTGKSIEECHKILGQAAAIETRKKQIELSGTGKHVSNTICKKVSYPICMSHPGYFLYDWIMEVLKTTFDLYSYQLITMANGSWWYDPIEEYLPEKIAACLYAQNVSFFTRTICWLEFLFMIFLWIGLCGGLWIYVITPLAHKQYNTMLKLWLTTIAMIGICVGLTGGFGYARLRLPIEPLIIILSLTFWYWLYCKKYINTQERSA